MAAAGGLDQLYQQVILDHYREKHGHGLRGPAAAADRAAVRAPDGAPDGLVWAESRQVNPLCGDEVTLQVAVAQGRQGPDGARAVVVRDVAWTGEGCSISQAASSVLHDLAVGTSDSAAGTLVGAFRDMVRSRGAVTPDEELLGDAVAFAGVGRHANRVKCAMLGWTAFEDALARARAELTQEPTQESMTSQQPATTQQPVTTQERA